MKEEIKLNPYIYLSLTIYSTSFFLPFFYVDLQVPLIDTMCTANSIHETTVNTKSSNFEKYDIGVSNGCSKMLDTLVEIKSVQYYIGNPVCQFDKLHKLETKFYGQ